MDRILVYNTELGVVNANIRQNQRKMFKNIETGQNVMFNVYRQFGGTTLIENLLVEGLETENKSMCYVSSHKQRMTVKEIVQLFAKYNGIKLLVEGNTIYNKEKNSSIDFETYKKYNTLNSYDIVFIDDAAFAECDIIERVFKDKNKKTQYVVSSCIDTIYPIINEKKGFTKFFYDLLEKIPANSEKPWFPICIKASDDERFLKETVFDNGKHATSEMLDTMIVNDNIEKCNALKKLRETLSLNSFDSEIANGRMKRAEYESKYKNVSTESSCDLIGKNRFLIECPELDISQYLCRRFKAYKTDNILEFTIDEDNVGLPIPIKISNLKGKFTLKYEMLDKWNHAVCAKVFEGCEIKSYESSELNYGSDELSNINVICSFEKVSYFY